MQGTLEVADKGFYDFITAVGEVSCDDFINLYRQLFDKRHRSENVYFIIDILNHPSVLDKAAFENILKSADASEIGHIDMLVISQDIARPMIGDMVEALSSKFTVDVNVEFFSYLKTAQAALNEKTISVSSPGS